MTNEEKKDQKELEVKLENSEEKEVEIPKNPIDDLIEKAETEEEKDKKDDLSYENEVKYDVETKKTVPYSEDAPYSERVRKRIAKEVAKRAEAEQRVVDLQERLANLEKRTLDIGTKSLKNQYQGVSSRLKEAIETGNTDEQVKLYEQMSDIRAQMTKIDDTKIEEPKKDKKDVKTPPLAADWVKENSQWFNKPGYRKETAMAYGIDAELTEEGWDVNDPEYYSEMDKRLKASKLPFFVKDKKVLHNQTKMWYKKITECNLQLLVYLEKKLQTAIELSSLLMTSILQDNLVSI